jgi:hypothetical protein
LPRETNLDDNAADLTDGKPLPKNVLGCPHFTTAADP